MQGNVVRRPEVLLGPVLLGLVLLGLVLLGLVLLGLVRNGLTVAITPRISRMRLLMLTGDLNRRILVAPLQAAAPLEPFSTRELLHVVEVEQQPPQEEENQGKDRTSCNDDAYDTASRVATAQTAPSIHNEQAPACDGLVTHYGL